MTRSLNDADFLKGIRRAVESNDVVVTQRPCASKDDALKAEYLTNRNVLFNGDKSHGIPLLDGTLLDGTVVHVDEARRIAMVCFGFGHQSFTDDVTFDRLVAVHDNELGQQCTIGRFSGRFIDLRVSTTA